MKKNYKNEILQKKQELINDLERLCAEDIYKLAAQFTEDTGIVVTRISFGDYIKLSQVDGTDMIVQRNTRPDVELEHFL